MFLAMSDNTLNRRKHPRAYTFSRVHVLFDRVESAMSLLDVSHGGFAVLASPETAGALLAVRGLVPITLIADELRVSSQAKLVDHNHDRVHGAFRLGFSLASIDEAESQALQSKLAHLQGMFDNAEAIEIRAS